MVLLLYYYSTTTMYAFYCCTITEQVRYCYCTMLKLLVYYTTSSLLRFNISEAGSHAHQQRWLTLHPHGVYFGLSIGSHMACYTQKLGEGEPTTSSVTKPHPLKVRRATYRCQVLTHGVLGNHRISSTGHNDMGLWYAPLNPSPSLRSTSPSTSSSTPS